MFERIPRCSHGIAFFITKTLEPVPATSGINPEFKSGVLGLKKMRFQMERVELR